MAEIKVTYETLFDLLRREKGRSELQELEKTFYEDVTDYLKEKNKTLDSGGITRGEREKIKIQLKNIKKILRELYELREKKIINLATSKVRTNSNLIDTSKLLEEEKEFFKETCELFSKYKTKILETTLLEEKNPEEDKQQEIKEDVKEKEQTKTTEDEIVTINILHDLPRFLGIDKKIYGPYKKGDTTKIPQATAKLLLDKKRAEKA